MTLEDAIRTLKARKSAGGGYDIVNTTTGDVLRHVKTKSAALQVLVSMRAKLVRRNPNNWKAGKWIKASAVRVRKVAGRVVMDIKKAI